jgi:hypothetical protein
MQKQELCPVSLNTASRSIVSPLFYCIRDNNNAHSHNGVSLQIIAAHPTILALQVRLFSHPLIKLFSLESVNENVDTRSRLPIVHNSTCINTRQLCFFSCYRTSKVSYFCNAGNHGRIENGDLWIQQTSNP